MSQASAHGRSQLNHQNLGWAVTRRRCLNIPVQAPTPDSKLVDRRYWIDSHRSFARASFFSQTRPARQQRKLYPARNGLVASTRISCSKRRTLRTRLRPVCARLYWRLKLIGMIAATVYLSSNCQLRVTTQKFCVVDGYTSPRTRKPTELSKSRGGRLPGTIR